MLVFTLQNPEVIERFKQVVEISPNRASGHPVLKGSRLTVSQALAEMAECLQVPDGFEDYAKEIRGLLNMLSAMLYHTWAEYPDQHAEHVVIHNMGMLQAILAAIRECGYNLVPKDSLTLELVTYVPEQDDGLRAKYLVEAVNDETCVWIDSSSPKHMNQELAKGRIRVYGPVAIVKGDDNGTT